MESNTRFLPGMEKGMKIPGAQWISINIQGVIDL
jgi:hypothetical protein